MILRRKFNQARLTAYINKTDIFGNTAILYAAYRGNIFIVRSLIECGADVNIVSKKGLNVLHMAAQGNNPNIIIYFKTKYNISVLSFLKIPKEIYLCIGLVIILPKKP